LAILGCFYPWITYVLGEPGQARTFRSCLNLAQSLGGRRRDRGLVGIAIRSVLRPAGCRTAHRRVSFEMDPPKALPAPYRATLVALARSGDVASSAPVARTECGDGSAVSSIGMDPLVAHQRAQETFAHVLVNVTSDQLSSPTPCSDWDVKALIDHVIAGNHRVVERAGGQGAPLPEDPGAAHRASAKAAQETFAEPQALTRTYQLPIGEVPGTAFIELRTSDLLIHAWDLAIATGQPSDLDPELAEYVLTFSRQMMSRPGLRGEGRPFGEEQPCGDERPTADRVAAFLGRELS
jgi:uncharacterized protein (TIGR03086 family)